MLLDDHEIEDNWEPVTDPPDDAANEEKKKEGLKAYKKYQCGRSGLETFDFDGFHFFMLNTRTERMHRKVDGNLVHANLFASTTMDRLKNWLSTNDGPKFVMSPSMLLPRHRRAVQRDSRLDASNLSALHSDSWDGYPNTLREVLAYIATKRIHHVVFLSGDEHRGCVATAKIYDQHRNPITRVHSIHAAAMYAPYPFANAIKEDFVAHETITIADRAENYLCDVNATWPPAGNGVTFLSVYIDGAAWKLDYKFLGGEKQTLKL